MTRTSRPPPSPAGFGTADDVVATHHDWDILVGRSVTEAVDPKVAAQQLITRITAHPPRTGHMIIKPLHVEYIAAVQHLIGLGGPYVWPRTPSDYWLYAELFSCTCPVAFDDQELAGVVIAFRSQNKPDDIYVQDVVTHPDHRRRDIAQALLDVVRQQATTWGCRRLYLTSEPDNHAARATWLSLGFTNVPGDHTVDGVSVTSNYKGPGKHRAVYQLMTK